MDVGIDSHGSEREGEGNSTYTRNLIRALLALDGEDNFTLFATDPHHVFYRSLGDRGRARLWPVRGSGGLTRIAWGLSRAAVRARVDCLHVQYFAPFLYRGPLVVTIHDLGFLHVPGSFPPALRLALRVFVPWSVRRASRVITVSEFTSRDLVRCDRLPAEKITVTLQGVGEGFRPLGSLEVRHVLARYGLEPGFLFSLGRLNRRKNLDRLLQAYRALRRGGVSDAPLVIGGKPDYGVQTLRRAMKDTDGVRWVGLIPDEDLPAFYSGAVCFIYASLFEGFGLPILEAMASGCPVVASDRASLPEVVGDAGLLVDPERDEAIAEGIARLVADDGLRAEFRERGLARSRQFTWLETARRTLEVYHEAKG